MTCQTLPQHCCLSSQGYFNCPYATESLKYYAEPIPGESTEHLSSIAEQCKIYLIGGEEFASEEL